MHDRSGEVMKCELKAAKIIRTKRQLQAQRSEKAAKERKTISS